MFAITKISRSFKLYNAHKSWKLLSTIETEKPTDLSSDKLSGFAKAYEKQNELLNKKENNNLQSFATLLRNSKFIDVSGFFNSYLLCVLHNHKTLNKI